MKALQRLTTPWSGELRRRRVPGLPAPVGLLQLRGRARAVGGAVLRGLRQPSPLLIALLAALALHLLALSYRQLRAQRQPEPAQPQLADDSPELLLFSRRQPLEETLQSAALPVPGNLPALSLPPLSSAQGRRLPLNSLPLNPLAPAPAELKPPEPLRGQRSTPPASPRPASRSQGPRASLLSQRPFNPRERGRESARGLSPSSSDSALSLLRRLQGRSAVVDPLKPRDSEQPSEPELQHPEGDRAADWRRLWKGATVVPASVLGQAPASEGIELRRLLLAEAAVDGLNADEPMALVVDERLLLLWPEGQTLWIWRAPLRSGARPAATKI